MLRRIFLFFALATLALSVANPTGDAIYKQSCALCHDHSSETRAPGPSALRQMSAESVVKALESGQMKQQGGTLAIERSAHYPKRRACRLDADIGGQVNRRIHAGFSAAC